MLLLLLLDGRGLFREGLAFVSAVDALGGRIVLLIPVPTSTFGSLELRGARAIEPVSRAVVRLVAEGDAGGDAEGDAGGDVDSETEAWLSPWLNPGGGGWEHVSVGWCLVIGVEVGVGLLVGRAFELGPLLAQTLNVGTEGAVIIVPGVTFVALVVEDEPTLLFPSLILYPPASLILILALALALALDFDLVLALCV